MRGAQAPRGIEARRGCARIFRELGSMEIWLRTRSRRQLFLLSVGSRGLCSIRRPGLHLTLDRHEIGASAKTLGLENRQGPC